MFFYNLIKHITEKIKIRYRAFNRSSVCQQDVSNGDLCFTVSLSLRLCSGVRNRILSLHCFLFSLQGDSR